MFRSSDNYEGISTSASFYNSDTCSLTLLNALKVYPALGAVLHPVHVRVWKRFVCLDTCFVPSNKKYRSLVCITPWYGFAVHSTGSGALNLDVAVKTINLQGEEELN